MVKRFQVFTQQERLLAGSHCTVFHELLCSAESPGARRLELPLLPNPEN